MKYLIRIFNASVLLTLAAINLISCSATKDSSLNSYNWLGLDTIKAGKYDMGKMWTFEYPPTNYFSEAYNFTPAPDWFDHIRLSALRFADYCSASFVSGDGLIMTNDHCARESLVEVQKDGEDLSKNGFYAETLEMERPVPGLYVDQLVLIKDITAEVQAEIDKGGSEREKLMNEDLILREIESRESDATGLEVSAVPLYNGGKFSLYGYKRYTDIRLVFAPESQIGFFGGDPDNFTYPRYNLDCSFFRVYEDSVPLETENYFKWSPNGPVPGKPVFVVGNPGSTDRLKTVSQLESMRDIQYPRTLDLIEGLISIYKDMIKQDTARADELTVKLLSYQNSEKAYSGMLSGLRDPVLIQRKRDFEQKLKAAVKSKTELNEKYGDVWDNIDEAEKELNNVSNELYIISMNPLSTPEYFYIAKDVMDLAEEMKLPESRRSEGYRKSEIDTTIADIFPSDFDSFYNNKLLKIKLDLMIKYLGKEHPLVKKLTNGLNSSEAVDYLLKNSQLTTMEKVRALIRRGPDAILNSDDPFIYFRSYAMQKQVSLQSKLSVLVSRSELAEQRLGKAVFEIYGTTIPPDATFTLRISDGVVKGFPYNGTMAPPIVTFYGLYDRYYSFSRKSPWDLPERWQNPPTDLNLEIPFNFVSTNDIIGGNSGSPVINEHSEIVGLAFDGNIQSLHGNFIFREEENRMVSVHSLGMIEALKKIYNAERLTDELLNGKAVGDSSMVSSETK
ncbi:MAG: S46 family peptidase [Ignavibacteria bacterium]